MGSASKAMTPIEYGLKADWAFRAAEGGTRGFHYIEGLGKRFIDCVKDGYGTEFKTGRVSWSAVKNQIAKDAVLLAEGRLKGVTWIFEKNMVSGLHSISPRVLAALKDAGITVVIR